MKSAILETAIKVIYVFHHPHHFNASLERQMALHTPRGRRSPWLNFTKARDDSDFIQVNDVT